MGVMQQGDRELQSVNRALNCPTYLNPARSVLDDNKKLCLPNSEIIAMSPTMSMIFEVGCLSQLWV